MKKNGFTLIELVVTIAIILAITAIAVPSTISLINRSKNSEYNGYIDSFVALSKTYFSDMGYQEDKVVNNVCYQITLDTLEDKQYLEDIPINPKTSEKFKGGVEIKLEGGKINYKYVENSSCIAPTNDLLANIDDDSVINMSESGDYENILLDVPTIVRQLMAKGNPLYIQSPKTIERSGMFMDQDDFGTTYYFYGSRGYINNIVEFAGHKWIITRVNGDETVRLVLYDTINMNEDNTKTDSNGIRVSEYGTHVFKYEDENPNDDYKNEYINNIQMYNIIHELPITSNSTGSLGGYTDTLNTAISNYTVSTFLENWIDEEISDKSKLVSNVSSDGKRYFCSEFPTNNTNYKCNASNNNTVVTNNLLSKHDIEQAGFDEFSINSFLSNGEKWITNSFNNSTYVSICDAQGESKSNQCNTSRWEGTSITGPGFIITNKLEASHNYYYVNNSKLSNKNLISVTGNYLPDYVVDKNVKRTLYEEDDNGDYVRYWPASKWPFYKNVKEAYQLKDRYFVKPDDFDSITHVRTNGKYIPKDEAIYYYTGRYYYKLTIGEIEFVKVGSSYKEIYNGLRYSLKDGEYVPDKNGIYVKTLSGNKYYNLNDYDLYAYRYDGNTIKTGTYYKITNEDLYYHDPPYSYHELDTSIEYELIDGQYYPIVNTKDIRSAEYDNRYYRVETRIAMENYYKIIDTKSNGKAQRYKQVEASAYDYRPLEITVENIGVRPVINLASDTRIKSGAGTYDNPFVLEFTGGTSE